MPGRTLIGLAVLLAGCAEIPTAPPGGDRPVERPRRIVSLDYCADQYVLKLAEPEQILAVSPDAAKDFSYMRDAALGVPTVRPRAEDVLSLKPDLVVRSHGGGPGVTAFLERAGIPVLQVGWASAIYGEGPGTIPALIRHMAEGLGQKERGEALVTEYRNRLGALAGQAQDVRALYVTSGGVTSGPGSLVHEMIGAAGLTNFQTLPGWHPIPLERLAYEQPDLVVPAFFETSANHLGPWSASRHPVARSLLDGADVVPLQGAWTACGGWFLLDAVEALAGGVSR